MLYNLEVSFVFVARPPFYWITENITLITWYCKTELNMSVIFNTWVKREALIFKYTFNELSQNLFCVALGCGGTTACQLALKIEVIYSFPDRRHLKGRESQKNLRIISSARWQRNPVVRHFVLIMMVCGWRETRWTKGLCLGVAEKVRDRGFL